MERREAKRKIYKDKENVIKNQKKNQKSKKKGLSPKPDGSSPSRVCLSGSTHASNGIGAASLVMAILK